MLHVPNSQWFIPWAGYNFAEIEHFGKCQFCVIWPQHTQYKLWIAALIVSHSTIAQFIQLMWFAFNLLRFMHRNPSTHGLYGPIEAVICLVTLIVMVQRSMFIGLKALKHHFWPNPHLCINSKCNNIAIKNGVKWEAVFRSNTAIDKNSCDFVIDKWYVCFSTSSYCSTGFILSYGFFCVSLLHSPVYCSWYMSDWYTVYL